MVLMLGILAFAIDTSLLYAERNRMAAAADAAAKSAAMEYLRKSTSDLQAFANREVLVNGFNPGGTTTVLVNRPPSSGPFAGSSYPTYVEVRVSQPTTTYFASAVNAAFGSVTPMARAVAGTSNPQNCFITKDHMEVKNNTVLDGCGAAVGGDLKTGGPITGNPTPNISVTGSCSGSCGANIKTGQLPPVDPLAGLVAPTFVGPCGAATVNPLPPGCYTSIPNTITQLQAGRFKVTGNITANDLTGSDVLLYLTNAANYDGGNSLTLTGRTADPPYTGVAIYADAGARFGSKNGFTLSITGAAYMPGVDVDFKNNLSIVNTGCSVLIFNTFAVKNNANIHMSGTGCATSFGNAAYLGISLAE